MTNDSGAQPYSHPPIVEAVFEVRFASEVAPARLRKARDWLAGRYAVIQTHRPTEAKVDLTTRETMFTEKPIFYALQTADATEEIALRPASVAWIKRAPYDGWIGFRERFAQELPTVMKAISPAQITRLGLRYVNRIDVPFEGGLAHYEDYLTFRINHGDILEPTLAYQWLVVKEFTDQRLKSIVQSAVLEREVLGKGAFSFDIDIASEIEVPQKVDDILSKLEAMRALKNDIFNAGITARAKELYA